jgi:hypothetical protein
MDNLSTARTRTSCAYSYPCASEKATRPRKEFPVSEKTTTTQMMKLRVLDYIKNNPGADYNDMVWDFITPLVDKIDALKARIESVTIDMENAGEIEVGDGGAMKVQA